MNSHDKTRTELRHCEAQLEKSQRQNLDEKTKREIQEAKHRGSLDGEGSTGGWKSAVSTRMYESKLKEMELELARRGETIAELKQQLRDAAEKEEFWQREKSDLLHQVRRTANPSHPTPSLSLVQATSSSSSVSTAIRVTSSSRHLAPCGRVEELAQFKRISNFVFIDSWPSVDFTPGIVPSGASAKVVMFIK